jgi:hypothetical protein
MDKEQLEKRFGVIAIEKKLITSAQLIEAIRIQVEEDIKKREHRPIGKILLEQGHITAVQIDEILKVLWEKALTEKGLIQDRDTENED